MAGPQLEDGYLKIANEIAEALAGIRISGEEGQCLWTILRKTYGWNKKEDFISLSQFMSLTKMKKPNISRAIEKLLSKKIIIIKIDNKGDRLFSINKNFGEWKPLSKKIRHDRSLSKLIKPVIKIDKAALSKLITTKDTTTKDTITKDTIMSDSPANQTPYQAKKKRFEAEAKEVLDYFNKIYREIKPGARGITAKGCDTEILRALRAGMCVEDCKKIIDNKSFDRYLIENNHFDPITLFRAKNAGRYLSQDPSEKGKAKIIQQKHGKDWRELCRAADLERS